MEMTSYLVPEKRLATGRSRASVYRFLASVFLTPIPADGVEYVRQMLAAIRAMPLAEDVDEMNEGELLLWEFAAETHGADPARVQRALSAERARLCRAVEEPDGPPPPYEGLYRTRLGGGAEACVAGVEQAYRQAGWTPDDHERQRPDYLGTELSFMATLCDEELAVSEDSLRLSSALIRERRFLEEHLLTWVPAYCRQMLNHSRTPFFQGIAHLLLGFLNEEAHTLG